MAKKAVVKEAWIEMSVSELQARLREAQEKSFRLKFQHAGNPVKNPMEIRWARRNIARILTALSNKSSKEVA